MLAAFFLLGATLELEVSPGFEFSDQASSPALRARAGVDLEWFTPSIAFFTAMFQDPGPVEETGTEGGLRAWGVAAQARFHTPGTHQLVGGFGIGWGQLIALQPENGYYGYRGQPAPYVQFFLGYRAEIGSVRLGIELTIEGFNRINALAVDVPYPSSPCVETAAGCPTHTTTWMTGLGFTLAFAYPR